MLNAHHPTPQHSHLSPTPLFSRADLLALNSNLAYLLSTFSQTSLGCLASDSHQLHRRPQRGGCANYHSSNTPPYHCIRRTHSLHSYDNADKGKYGNGNETRNAGNSNSATSQPLSHPTFQSDKQSRERGERWEMTLLLCLNHHHHPSLVCVQHSSVSATEYSHVPVR